MCHHRLRHLCHAADRAGPGRQARLKPSGHAVISAKAPADQGTATAQCGLGNMYPFGKGVAQNHAEAIKWYRLAADQGNADGQYDLGVI